MTSVLGTILLVAVVVVLAATMTVFVLDLGESTQPVAPGVQVTTDLVEDGNEWTVAVTLVGGEAVRTNRLSVAGSKPLDIGGPPTSSTPADEQWASDRENFIESSGGNPPQVGIGETWEAGETVYLDPTGAVEDTTIGIYWNTQPVSGINPGSVEGEHSYKIAEIEL
jgi:hypothetical protein